MWPQWVFIKFRCEPFISENVSMQIGQVGSSLGRFFSGGGEGPTGAGFEIVLKIHSWIVHENSAYLVRVLLFRIIYSSVFPEFESWTGPACLFLGIFFVGGAPLPVIVDFWIDRRGYRDVPKLSPTKITDWSEAFFSVNESVKSIIDMFLAILPKMCLFLYQIETSWLCMQLKILYLPTSLFFSKWWFTKIAASNLMSR